MSVLFLHNSLPEYRIKFWELIDTEFPVRLLITHKGLEKKLYSLEKDTNRLKVEYWCSSTWSSVVTDINDSDVVVLPPVDSIFDYIVSVYIIILCAVKSKPYVYWTEKWEPDKSCQPISRRIKNFIYKAMVVSLCKGSKACVVSGTKSKEYLEKNGLVNLCNKIYVAFDSNTSPKPQEDIDIRKLYNIPESNRIILYLGRIMERKGVDILLKAAIPILTNNDVSLLICGDGEFLPECKRIVDLKPQIKDKVVFAGKIQPRDRAAYYQQSDLFVIPAIMWHGMIDIWALTVNESLEQGTPVISTTAVGASYDLINEKNGVVVEEGDTEQLHKAMVKALFENKLYKYRQNIIDEYNQKFSVPTMAKSFVNVLKQVVK